MLPKKLLGHSLLVHGRGSSLAEISLLGLGFSDTLGEDGGVLVLEEEMSAWSQSEYEKGKLTAASLVRSELRRLSAIR
jgi:hypothetical protein